jgi:RNA polymerase sigma-70 factor (ECF subfamily)
MLDIEESTSRSQYTRAKTMLEDILVKKNILLRPRSKTITVLSGAVAAN